LLAQGSLEIEVGLSLYPQLEVLEMLNSVYLHNTYIINIILSSYIFFFSCHVFFNRFKPIDPNDRECLEQSNLWIWASDVSFFLSNSAWR